MTRGMLCTLVVVTTLAVLAEGRLDGFNGEHFLSTLNVCLFNGKYRRFSSPRRF